MFCKCGNMYVTKDGKKVCPKCGAAADQTKTAVSIPKLDPNSMEAKKLEAAKEKEKLKRELKNCPVVEGIEGTMPRTNVPCPKCEHNEAYWYLRQTRKSDEPETTFLTCCKCGHKWRKY